MLLAVSLRDYDCDRLKLLMEDFTAEHLYSPFSLFEMRGQLWRTMLESIVLDNSLNDIGFMKEKVAEIIAL